MNITRNSATQNRMLEMYLMRLFAVLFMMMFSGTGVKATMTQPSTLTSSESNLILEIIVQPPTGNPTGSRVFNDGRYEFLSDTEIVVGLDGKSTRNPVALEWRSVYTFTKSEILELKEAIKEADFPKLQAVYQPSNQNASGSTMTWRVLIDGKVKQVIVKGYPNNTVPALETLYKRFNQIHKLPKASSIWHVLTSSGVVTRTIDCDVSSVGFLRPVLQALFASDNLNSATTSAKLPAADAVLLEIVWQENGKEIEQTKLFGDGRYVLFKNKTQTLVKTLNPAQVELVIKSLEAISWKDLPEPVCE